jgi:Na+/H+-dicarboxylate symporter
LNARLEKTRCVLPGKGPDIGAFAKGDLLQVLLVSIPTGFAVGSSARSAGKNQLQQRVSMMIWHNDGSDP